MLQPNYRLDTEIWKSYFAQRLGVYVAMRTRRPDRLHMARAFIPQTFVFGCRLLTVLTTHPDNGRERAQVMTFGAPMVTDAAGAAKLKALLPVMRVTHERDPVPLTPLESGSRTSAAAVKLLTKSGGGSGGGGHGESHQVCVSRTSIEDTLF